MWEQKAMMGVPTTQTDDVIVYTGATRISMSFSVQTTTVQ